MTEPHPEAGPEKLGVPKIYELIAQKADRVKIVQQVVADLNSSNNEAAFLGLQELIDRGTQGYGAISFMAKKTTIY